MPNIYPVLYTMGMTWWEKNPDEGPLPQLLAGRRPGRALDSGCGSGRHAIEMARRGWTVVGVDVAAQPLRTARQRSARAGVADRVTFVKADVAALNGSIDGAFELVVDIGCLHGLGRAQQMAFARWIDGHTARGSVMVIHAAQPRSGIGPKGLDAPAVAALFPAWSLRTMPSTTRGGGPLRGATFRWFTLERQP